MYPASFNISVTKSVKMRWLWVLLTWWMVEVSAMCNRDVRISSVRCESIDSVALLQSEIERALGMEEGFLVDRLLINRCQLEVIETQLIKVTDNLELRHLALINSKLVNLSMASLTNVERSLREVDLSANALKVIPEALLALTALTAVDLSGNRIRNLPHGSAFNNWNALIKLNLANNKLGSDSSSLSLLDFNLEPLTDTLEELDVSRNELKTLPDQLVRRHFARLRVLRLRGNPLKELPLESFSGMQSLEVLDLSHTKLATLKLSQSTLPFLRHLILDQLPLRCDCSIKWIFDLMTNKDGIRVEQPLCATPFKLRNRPLFSIKESDVCPSSSSSSALVPHFYRISRQDEWYLPQLDFKDLQLKSVFTSPTSLRATWTVDSDFYESGRYDWALIVRTIGESYNGSVFFKTKYDLSYHIASNELRDWRPSDEKFDVNINELEADNFYEICLAALDPLLYVYYVHRENCRERRTPTSSSSSSTSPSATSSASSTPLSLRVSSTEDSLVVNWVPMKDENSLRVISVRQFGTSNVSIHRVWDASATVLEQDHRQLIIDHLISNTAYELCMESLSVNDDLNDTSQQVCREQVTLGVSDDISVMATASVVSSSTTAFFVILIFCCCCPKRRKQEAEKKLSLTNQSEKENVDETIMESKTTTSRYELSTSSSSSLSRTQNTSNTPAWWRHTWLGPRPSYHYDKELYLPKRPATRPHNSQPSSLSEHDTDRDEEEENVDDVDEEEEEGSGRGQRLAGLPLSVLDEPLNVRVVPRHLSFRQPAFKSGLDLKTLGNSVNPALLLNNGRRRSSLFTANISRSPALRLEVDEQNLNRDKLHTWSNRGQTLSTRDNRLQEMQF